LTQCAKVIAKGGDFMNKLHFVLVLLVSLIITTTLIVISERQANWQKEKSNNDLSWEKAKFELQLKEKCQELSATTTNASWGYKSCLQELKLLNPETKTL
jgi:hypothetical protein